MRGRFEGGFEFRLVEDMMFVVLVCGCVLCAARPEILRPFEPNHHVMDPFSGTNGSHACF